MKVLRSSAFTAMHEPPVTSFMRESDLNVSIEQAMQELTPPGILCISEIVEVSNDLDASDIARLSARIDQKAEADMCVLYFWTVGHFAMMKPGGVIATKDPAPIDAARVRYVLEQIAKHPSYPRGLNVVVASQDGKMLVMKDGQINESTDH